MTRKWLQALIDQYLPAIASLPDTEQGRAEAARWAAWMKDRWAAHGLPRLNQQRNLMTDVRNAIKQTLGENHFALESMNFEPDEWTRMNHAIEDRVAQQNESQVILSPKTVNAVVYRATNLLASREWADIACGLAVLTGRRHTEIMKTAQFHPKTAYSVIFSGALKRRNEADGLLLIEIPTLCQAAYVLTAIARLREIVPTAELSNAQVNSRYSDGVTKACDRHFADLVPPATGRETLYTHLFRKLYAAIAHYFYCPRWVSDWEFKAHIQGHYAYIDADNPVMRRKIAADRHYDAYAIEDDHGNRRKGVKLGDRDVEIIEIFQRREESPPTTQAQPQTMQHPIGTSDIQDELDHLTQGDTGSAQASPSGRAVKRHPLEDTMTHSPDPHSDVTDEAMTDYSAYPLISLSDAYQRAKERGFSGSKGSFRYQARTYRDDIAAQYGVIHDLTVVAQGNPQLPSWRDIQTVAEAEEPSPTAAASPPTAPSSRELEWVQKLSTGIDFLSREVDLARSERDAARAERDRIQQEWQTEKETLLKQLNAQTEQNTRQQQQLDQVQAELRQLKATYKELEPILRLVGKAQNQLQDVADAVPTQQTTHGSATSTSGNGNGTGRSPTPNTPPSPRTTQPASSPQSNASGLDPVVNQALDAIFAYNNQSGRSHEEKWAISYPVMKDLLAQVGAATQSKIKAVFDARHDEIEQHHQTHRLGQRHNRVHAQESISDVIQLE